MYRQFDHLRGQIKIAISEGYPCSECLKDGNFRYLGNNKISLHHWKYEKSFLVHLKMAHDLNQENYDLLKSLLREFIKTKRKDLIQFLFEKEYMK